MKFIDNFTVKTKLIFLYALCVVVPMLVTNWIVINIISTNLNEQQLVDVEGSYDKVYMQLREGVNQCIKLANIVFTDARFNEAASKKFTDMSDYFNTFDNFLREYFNSYRFAFPQIRQTGVFLENESIINGGNYYKIDNTVRSTYWYRQVKSNGSRLFHIIGGMDGKTKSLSLIKNNPSSNEKSRNGYLIKIDLDFKYFNDILSHEFAEGKIYIYDENGRVIFSNSPETNKPDAFYSIKDIEPPEGSISIVKSLEGILDKEKWNVSIFTPRRHIFSGNDSKLVRIYIFLIFINLLIPTMVIVVISKSLNTRLRLITKYVKKVDNQKFEFIEHTPARDEIGQLMEAFNSMVQKIKQLISDVYEVSLQKKNIELQKRQAEINALQSQINPHFLFNCLGAINMRSMLKGEKETAQIVKNLANLFRISLTWDKDMITVSEEISFVRNYLEIEQYRFGEELKYSIFVDNQAESCRIPKMSLTTFVENACVHGIENTEGYGLITVKVLFMGKYIECSVIDNGIGMQDEQIDDIKRYIENEAEVKKNVGIKNVIRRLTLYFGDELGYDIISTEGQGVRIWFRIPAVYDEESM